MSALPPVRVAPPAPWQHTADPLAPFVAYFANRGLAAAALDDPRFRAEASVRGGVLVSDAGSTVRVTAPGAVLAELAEALATRDAPTADLLRRALQPPREWRLRTRALPLDRPQIMGIVNLTDDSFSGDGVGKDLRGALERADALRAAGASIVDVGAETARADRPVMDEAEEARVVGPAVAALVREGHLVSSDTYKPLVARAALESGAEIVNDISGLTLGTAAAGEATAAGAGYVLNYSYSVPKKRPERPPVYADVVTETLAWMLERLDTLEAIGLAGDRVAIDPGIAFGKSHDEDLQVLRRLAELRTAGRPILLAHSRKNFIGSVNGAPPRERDLETHVATALAYAQGARIFRVHDAAGTCRAAEMAAAITAAAPGAFAPDEHSWPWRAGVSASHLTRAAADKDAPAGQRW